MSSSTRHSRPTTKQEREHSFGIIPFYKNASGDYIFFIGKTRPQGGGTALWKFPKGHRDPKDKHNIETALRELKEETGIKMSREEIVAHVSFEERYSFERKRGARKGEHCIVHKVNTYWLGRIARDGESPPDVVIDEREFGEFQWASFEEVYKLLPKNTRAFFSDAHNFLVANRV